MKSPYKIAIIDYQMSNMFSIKNALNALGFESEITSSRSKILSCDGAILPGVGSFPEAMKHIKSLNLDESINGFINTGKPFMGICLGYQLLFEKSEEVENTYGLGIMSGEVKKIPKKNKETKVPHVGWNNVKRNTLLNGVQNIGPLKAFNDDDYFYFVHSYYAPITNSSIGITDYSESFASIIQKDNFYGTQFHPEKSSDQGSKLLRTFINL